jgi:hypothetical protein
VLGFKTALASCWLLDGSLFNTEDEISTGLHGVTSQKAKFFIDFAVETSDPTIFIVPLTQSV